MWNVRQWKTDYKYYFYQFFDKRSTCSPSLTRISHYTALFTCERTLRTFFHFWYKRQLNNYYHYYIYKYIYIHIYTYMYIYKCVLVCFSTCTIYYFYVILFHFDNFWVSGFGIHLERTHTFSHTKCHTFSHF